MQSRQDSIYLELAKNVDLSAISKLISQSVPGSSIDVKVESKGEVRFFVGVRRMDGVSLPTGVCSLIVPSEKADVTLHWLSLKNARIQMYLPGDPTEIIFSVKKEGLPLIKAVGAKYTPHTVNSFALENECSSFDFFTPDCDLDDDNDEMQNIEWEGNYWDDYWEDETKSISKDYIRDWLYPELNYSTYKKLLDRYYQDHSAF